jgi:steroid delta-isomerase-like uncharacterized protein
MSEENKVLVRRFYDEVFNGKKLDLLQEFITPDFVDHNPDPGQEPGLDGMRQLFGMLFTGYPDLHMDVDFQIAEGDKVASRVTVHGTNTGEFMGMPATGKEVRITGADVVRIVDGKFVERWGNFDELAMMQQLGAIPRPEDTMAQQALTDIACDMVDAFNNSDWERTKGHLTVDTVYNEVGTQRRLQGTGQIIEALQGWKQAMPDVTGTVTNALASGSKVALEVTWDGTHTGPLASPGGTIPASGRRQTTHAAWIFDFEGDKVKESRQYFDMLTFLQQIGAIPQ